MTPAYINAPRRIRSRTERFTILAPALIEFDVVFTDEYDDRLCPAAKALVQQLTDHLVSGKVVTSGRFEGCFVTAISTDFNYF
jgi:hypothetical protein